MGKHSFHPPINGNPLGRWETALGFFLVLPLYQWGILWVMRIGLEFLMAAGVEVNLTSGVTVAWWNVAFYFLLLLVLALVFHRFLLAEWKIFRYNFSQCMKGFLTWILIAFAANILGALLVSLLMPGKSNPNQDAIVQATDAAGGIMVLATILLGPICEEILFRGLIFRTLRRRFFVLAHVVSAVAFAMIHLLEEMLAGDWSLFPMLLPYFFMGLILSAVYEAKHTIVLPILVHMAVNCIALLA